MTHKYLTGQNEMDEQPKSRISAYSEWIFRLILLAGVVGNLWLTQNFVTRKEFETQMSVNSMDHISIKGTIVEISATLKILALNQSRLDDHEARLRLVETRQVDVMSRLLGVEKVHERNREP